MEYTVSSWLLRWLSLIGRWKKRRRGELITTASASSDTEFAYFVSSTDLYDFTLTVTVNSLTQDYYHWAATTGTTTTTKNKGSTNWSGTPQNHFEMHYFLTY